MERMDEQYVAERVLKVEATRKWVKLSEAKSDDVKVALDNRGMTGGIMCKRH